MNADDRIQEIFAQALDRKSPAEREKFLAAACRGEPELRPPADSLQQPENFRVRTEKATQPTKDT